MAAFKEQPFFWGRMISGIQGNLQDASVSPREAAEQNHLESSRIPTIAQTRLMGLAYLYTYIGVVPKRGQCRHI